MTSLTDQSRWDDTLSWDDSAKWRDYPFGSFGETGYASDQALYVVDLYLAPESEFDLNLVLKLEVVAINATLLEVPHAITTSLVTDLEL